MASEAKTRYDVKWHKETYDTIRLNFRKDAELTLDMVKKHAFSRGESTNGFITRAVKEAIARGD